MSDLLKECNIQDLIKTPLAYLLNVYENNDLSNILDENGWTIMHWAVANADLSKVKELIHFNFDFAKNSSQNYIPLNAYVIADKKKSDNIYLPNKVPFCIKGFSSLHLLVFLFDHYKKLSNEFFYSKCADKHLECLKFLVDSNYNILSIYDSNGYSLFDYAFLLENIELIEYLFSKDNTFSTLNRVKLTVAKKIIEVIKIKTNKTCDEFLVTSLDKAILHTNLNKELAPKIINIKTIQKV